METPPLPVPDAWGAERGSSCPIIARKREIDVETAGTRGTYPEPAWYNIGRVPIGVLEAPDGVG